MRTLLFTLALLTLASPAHASSCGGEWNDTETYELDGSDLVQHSGVSADFDAYGESACIFWSDSTLDEYRLKVERSFRKKVESRFTDHYNFGKPEHERAVCRFEDTRGLAAEASFDAPPADSAVNRALLKTRCGGQTKRNRFAFVKLAIKEATVKIRCGVSEKMQEWEAACGQREPSSVKKAKPKKK